MSRNLSEAAARFLWLYNAGYLRAHSDGGRVKHSAKELQEAITEENGQLTHPMNTTTQPNMHPTETRIAVRSYYFGQLVADYFAAFGFYPKWHEMRAFFITASRKADSYDPDPDGFYFNQWFDSCEKF